MGSIPGGSTREIVLVLAPTGTGDIRNCASVQFEHGLCVTTKLGRAELRIEKRGPRRRSLMTSSTTSSSSRTTAPRRRGLLVIDSLPDGLALLDSKAEGQPALEGRHTRRWERQSLAAGQSWKLEYSARARTAGTFRNEAVVEAPGHPVQKASHEIAITEPKLSLEMRGPTGSPLHVGVPMVYEIIVSNPGTGPATNVEVADRLPSQMFMVSSNAGGRKVGGSVVWQLGTLPAGARRSLQLVAQASATGRSIEPSRNGSSRARFERQGRGQIELHHVSRTGRRHHEPPQ